MKSKITKIQILKKGMAILLISMFMLTPITYATTSLDDSYLQGSLLDQILYGTIGSTVKEIEEYLKTNTTLYISNETQLRALAEYVNNGNSCYGKEIILLNDIEVDKEKEWVPIGKSGSPFNGILNGNGYTISGVTYLKDNKTKQDLTEIGLFGFVNSDGIVKNINIENFNINMPYEENDIISGVTTYYDIGNIAGINAGRIENCANRSNIYGLNNLGGIVGRLVFNGVVINCSNYGNVVGYDAVGGIVGATGAATTDENVTIKNCINSATIIGVQNVGGIVGKFDSEGSNLTNCTNNATINSEGNSGGIIGCIASGTNNTTNNINRGIVTSTSQASGGIIGWVTTGTSYIKNCINYSKITAKAVTGGIVGSAGGSNTKLNLTIQNSINKGIVSNTNQISGGIIGYATSGTNINITNCLNTGDVSTADIAGGIIGYEHADNLNLSKCTNSGTITATAGSNKGPILGYTTKTLGTIGNATITEEQLVNDEIIGYKDNNNKVLSSEFGVTKVKYNISKNGEKVLGKEYFKEGDVITVTAEFDKYLANNYGPIMPITEAPTLKINDKIEMTSGEVIVNTSNYTTTIEYTYTIQKGDNFEITELMLYKNGTIYALSSDYATNQPEITINKVNIELSNLIVDTTMPIINTKVYVENELETGRYIAGKEVILEVTTNESIVGNYTLPEIQVSFSESGIGKYNYKEETEKVGFAKCINAKINIDGTTTWIYSYQIQEGDEGNIEVSYKAGEITDLAGNTTNVATYLAPKDLEDTTINNSNGGIEISKVEFLQNNEVIEKDAYVQGDFVVRVYVNPIDLYTDIQTPMNKDTAPDLFINGNVKQNEISNINIEKGYIEYQYNSNQFDSNKLTKITQVKLLIRDDVDLYTKDQLIYNGQPIEDKESINGEFNNFYIDPSNMIENIKIGKIYADTTLPTVVITPDVDNSLTNKDTITYEFLWSEELVEFTKDDITVNNGEVTELSEATLNEDGTYLYTATIKTSIENGNVGNLQVIIEQDACQDLAAHGNVRTESIITVDRKAPIIQSLEAYVESGIKLNNGVDVVKEHYKLGEVIKVITTFDENVVAKELPELVLQFSESKNSVVPEGVIEGNKIIYTYTITEGDEGTVSIRAFNGTVTDAAGNETKVTRKALDGNNIIVDTKAPSLKELNVTTSAGTYNAGKTITIEAIYDENVYALKDNEIKNISSELAPTLKVKFGNGEEREATFAGYAGEDKTRLEYTVAIIDTDNGILSITSYENKENVEVCDIAGNIAELNNKQTGNEITADNIRPVVESIEAKVEYPSISGTDIYYKEGNTVKITLTFSEEVSSAVLFPRILVGFSEEAGKEPAEYTEYAYESDWNVNSKTIEYSYTIRNGENGYLWVKVPEGQFRDAAGNTNTAKDAEEKLNVYADTIIPTVTLYRDTEETQNNQIITIKATFNENIYDLNGNRRVTLTTGNAPKLIYSFGDGANREASATSINGATITYTITKDAVEDNGDIHYELAKGNLCDRAGNELYKTTLDTTAPVLESVVITSNAGILYAPYCKEGKEIYVIATFNEPIKAENIKLKAKVGEVEISELLDGEIVEENDTKVKFTYTVKAGDMGEFKILDICGETDSKITEENADNTYGWVQDEYGNQNNIYSLEDERVTATGKAEADTKDPYITSIKALVDGEEIATYTKEDGKDAVITVGRTNENIVEYIVTYNEKISILDKSNISIENGIIKSIEYTDFALNEFKITVQTTVEGVQSLIINEGTVEDKAGNIDSFVRLNAVTVDFTKPTVRFISEYNGGVYVLPTNIDKVEIRPNVEISEDIAKIEYKWDDEEYVEIENYSSSSDIAVPTKAFTEYGQYKLFIKVVDLAGNVSETSKTYEITNSYIGISTSTTEYTNQDITATVVFGDGLTDNRKVTFKTEGSSEVVELNAAGTNQNGTEYTIWTNGTIYAEATDRVGNKVFTEYTVYNIDKDAPEITFDEYYLTTLVNKEIEVGISLNESAKISYSWDNETWEETNDYVRSLDVTKTFTEVGKYTLYVKAIDKAGNESSADIEIEVVNLSFEVLGNATEWTSNDVELYVYCEGELASITVNGETVNVEDRTYSVTANGEYEFVVTDKYGNTAVAIDNKGNIIEGNKIIVNKIDKEGPTIEKTEVNGKEITITAKDDKSGLKEYAITKTTEETLEWSKSNVIKVSEDGKFYVWSKDNVGNVTMAEETVIVDTTAPIITFNYTSLTVTVGVPLETNIVTNEDAIISYSWDNETWVDSEELLTSLKVTEKSTTTGKYTLYVKAKDGSGNESKVQTLEFEVVTVEEIKQPDIIFEDIPTIQVDGIKYVKVSTEMTTEILTDKMNKVALCGKTPEYTKLTEDNKLRTGSEIAINGSTKYVVIVNGDVNCDGNVTFLGDVVMANNYRIGQINLSVIQRLAADVNNSGVIEFIPDIVAMNNYRLGIIKSL